MRISELFEGVVARRGNILEVGSLKLQLYSDHIFYVVKGGADLSIYKDGAFKPPRNNEIYLKDAARHGVPQAFINLFAKFFATNDVDVVVNGLEQLFNKHVKEGEFREPKFGKYYQRGEFRYDGKVIGLIFIDRDGRYVTYRQNPKNNNSSRLVKTHRSKEDAENYLISKYNEIIGSIDEGNKENKAKKNAVMNPSMREKKPKPSTFDPRVDLKKKVAEEKKKGKDGKACWDGYKYAGTENGKDKCVKVKK